MAKTLFIRTKTTGNPGDDSLDEIDGQDLNDGDLAIVCDGSDRFIFYELDATIGGAESDPELIEPNDNSGSKRWVAQNAYSSGSSGANPAYESTMTGNETFTQVWSTGRVYLLDPNGADRTFNPSGVFASGYTAQIWNKGNAYNIVFDSTATAQNIPPGGRLVSVYNGSSWM